MRPGWVLDLGCEYGFGSLLVAETNPRLQVLAVDHDFSFLSYSRGLPVMESIPRVNASGYKLPIATGCLTGVYLVNLLHMVDDTAAVISETRRVLKSEGMAILSIPLDGSQETDQSRHSLIRHLANEIKKQFSEVIFPKEICGNLPSFPPQSFLLDQHASTWIAICINT